MRPLAIRINQQLNNAHQLDETIYETHSAKKQISISKLKTKPVRKSYVSNTYKEAKAPTSISLS